MGNRKVMFLTADFWGQKTALRPFLRALATLNSLIVYYLLWSDPNLTHPDILEHNAKMLGADLTAVDIAILSHNHIDHIDGFDYLLKVNPDFKLFV